MIEYYRSKNLNKLNMFKAVKNDYISFLQCYLRLKEIDGAVGMLLTKVT